MTCDALLLLLGLLGAIFVHEGAHCVVARTLGMKVVRVGVGWAALFSFADRSGTQWRIGLLPLGGFCHFASLDGPRPPCRRSTRQTALAALCVTAAGPAASMLLAAAIYHSIGIGHAVESGLPLGGPAIALCVAYFSLLTGLFNLLPIPPLDGGRMWLLAFEAVRGAPVADAPKQAFDRSGRTTITAMTLISIVGCAALLIQR